MRRVAPALLAALLLLAPAGAHDEGAHHVTPFTVVLGPSQGADVPIEFEGGPLFAGWVFFLVARTVSNGTDALADLRLGTTTVSQWTLPAGQTVRRFALIQETGDHAIHFANPGPSDTVRVEFYFDQACNCAGKVLPHEFSAALVVFNVDFTSGDAVAVEIPEPRAVELRVSLAVRHGPGAEWPADYTVLDVSEAATLARASPADPWVRLHRFVFTATATATHYLFVEATRYIAANDTPPDPANALVVPYLKRTPAAPFPVAAAVLAIAAVGVVVAVFLWRERSAPEEPPEEGGKGLSRRGPRRSRRGVP